MSAEETKKPQRATAVQSGVTNVATALLVLVLAGVANYLAFRHYKRFDWTSQGLHTLSDRTVHVLRGLNHDVDLYVFMSSHEPTYQDLDATLQLYRAETPHLRIHNVDPYTRPQEFLALVQRFHLAAAQEQDTGDVVTDVDAVVANGDRVWKIDRDDLVSLDVSGEDPTNEAQISQQVKTEQALTGALVQVTSGRPTKACFTRGHGEWSLEEGGGERTLAMVKDELERNNVTTQTIDFSGAPQIAHDCDAVFVIGPQTSFTEGEARALGEYVRRGGNALLTLDPVLSHGDIVPTGLEAWARGLGATIDADVVVETDRGHVLQQEVFLVTDIGHHATVDMLRRVQSRIGMRTVRSVRAASGGHATELLKTTADAFGETTLTELEGAEAPVRNGHDVVGPLGVAVAIDTHATAQAEGDAPHHGPPGGRVVIVGGSQWLRADLMQRSELGNIDLVDGFAGWLTQRPALISIAPHRMHVRAVSMTGDDLQGVLFRVLVLLPAAALFLGIAVWWTRRS